MSVLKALNLLVRFLLELCMLAAVGYWGFKVSSSWPMKLTLGIGLLIMIAVGWWLTWKLHGIPRLVLELTLLGSGAVALFASTQSGFRLGLYRDSYYQQNIDGSLETIIKECKHERIS